jgi:MYXO-CTERM domain-containing protein
MAIGMAGASPAQAQVTVVPVNNANFENPGMVDNMATFSPTQNNTPGYFANSNAFPNTLHGVLDPNGDADGPLYEGDTPNGQYGAVLVFVDGGFGLITQQLATTVQPNTIYTLTLDVGGRTDEAFPTIGAGDTGGNIRTYLSIDMTDAAGNPTGSPEAFASLTAAGASIVASRPAPTPGFTLSSWSIVYTTPDTIPAAFLGKTVTFNFTSGDLGDPSNQAANSALIDNIAVSTQPGPEPAAGLLGAAALLVLRRRSRVA